MDHKSKPFFVRLPGRGLVRIAGPDREAFLQPLVSNDLRLLDRQTSVYSCFLSPQGKFLHDFFICREGDALVLECEGGVRAEDLMKRLKPFKLRSKVDLSFESDVPIFAVFGVGQGFPDPRRSDMGFRTRGKPEGMEEKPFEEWDERRIRLCIPDGSRDMAVDKDTLLECNMDRINGVSFDKGCYVGQEITARMHLRGLVKKHLCAVKISGAAPEPFTDIVIDGRLTGQMRSHCNGIGLALLKDDSLPLPAAGGIRVLNSLHRSEEVIERP
jgi:folate-binding protein YgfZ